MKTEVFKFSFITLLLLSSLHAEDAIEADLNGFDMQESSETDLDGFGEDLDGFSTQKSLETSHIPKKKQKQSTYTILGKLSLKANYGYREHRVKANKSDSVGIEYSGFNQAQISTYLQFDTKLSKTWKIRISGDSFYDAIYDLNSHNNYNQDTLNTYKTQLRLDDTYIQGSITKDFDAKIGRQIVVWGKSDSIRITDIINPLDNRLPGLTDIGDLRLSTTMAKFDYYKGDWNFSAMAIVESRIFLEAAPRSEYFPVDSIFSIAPDPFVTLAKPSNILEDMQYALAANGVFSGWDLSFYAANVLDSKWHIEGTLPNTTRVVSKIKMIGSAFNLVQGSWLYKSEVALINGIKYNSTSNAKRRLDTLVGLDYMGIKNTTVSLELANRHIFDYEEQMSGIATGKVPDYVQQDEIQTAIRVTHSMQNDTLNGTVVLNMFGHNWQYGGFFRASLEYDVRDALVVNLGVIDYINTSIKSEKPFTNAISNNDKIYIDVTFSF
ncbi:hypothetical protein MNB_SM-4-159 [hydrothermal vent metagenome]|uniref:DUF1302 domain-containing protein n=1 Tax=hydrothermal vent metagenome TaxID=652676 RepID=A0A1W1BG48_9ZZZZ